jgi:hypothetical protein
MAPIPIQNVLIFLIRGVYIAVGLVGHLRRLNFLMSFEDIATVFGIFFVLLHVPGSLFVTLFVCLLFS